MNPRWWVALLLALMIGLASVSNVKLERLSAGRETAHELMYLPNGKYLKIASLGQASVLADLIYLWAIQYYSSYDREDRYRYVEHVFGDVIAELDPHYIDPYWVGALIMTVEGRDLEAGLRLLNKGFEKNPEEWILPYVAAWECYYAGQAPRAAAYFKRAAETPGAPPAVLRLHAGMVGRAGNLAEAVGLWTEILDDPDGDPASKAVARRQIRHLKVTADVTFLQRAVNRFREENDRYPKRLDELTRRGYIPAVPQDPAGQQYRYDARTGRVSSAAGRILGVD